MPPPELAQLSSLVPGTGALNLEPLSTGLKAETFKVRRDGALYALRVSNGAPAERRFEIAVLSCAAHAGLAPRLIAADPDGTLLILEWLEGAALSEQAAKQPDAKFAALLNRVHALPPPLPPRVMNPRTWMAHYEAALRTAGIESPRERAVRAAFVLARLEAQGPPPKACICHSDLHRLNVLVRGCGPLAGELALLDWEYAHVSEPLWDLAGWSANNDFPPAAQLALLAAYYGRAPTALEGERLGLLGWLYDYVCLQWMRLYVTRQGAAGAGFATRAVQLERRLDSPVYGTIAVPTNF